MEFLEEKKRRKKINPVYLKGVGGKARTERRREIERRSKEPHEDPHSYRPFKTDKDPRTGDTRKTKPSKWNKKFKQMFGEAMTDVDFTTEELMEADLDLLEAELIEEDTGTLEWAELLESYLVEYLLLEKKKGKSNVTQALKNKAKKANAPMGALRAIYNKGLAAWRTGHRPGASPAAWGMARVNSVLAGGPARKVDAAQWKSIQKHRSKKRKK